MSHPIRRLNDFAECCVFAKQSVDPLHCDPSCEGHPFFQSYGANLPSSLTRFHSRALAHLCPPTCVGLRYGRLWEQREAFLGTLFIRSTLAVASASPCGTVTINRLPDSEHASLHALTIAGAGMLNLLAIVYALRPRLRSRLTLRGRTLPRKPWVYGGPDSHRPYRYSCLHSHL